MTIATAFALWAAAMIAVAALARNRPSARIGVILAAALLPLPLLVTGVPNLRALLAFAIMVCLACAVDYASGRTLRTFAARLIHSFAFLALIDTFTASPCSRKFDARAVANTLVALAIVVAALLLWRMAADFPTWGRIIVWHFAAGVMVLAAAEIMASVVRFATTLFGVALRPVHDAPYRSRTVGEFWSSRWNLATARWLRDYCFRPLVRRGPVVALLATFAVSAALHVYLILVPGDALSLLSWAAFFLAQPLVILIERKIHVRHWPRAAGHAWTIGSLMLLSPLLFGPILKIIDPSN